MKGWSRTKHLHAPAVSPGDVDECVHGIGNPSWVVGEEVEILGGSVDQFEREQGGATNEHESFRFAQCEERGGDVELSAAEFSHDVLGR